MVFDGNEGCGSGTTVIIYFDTVVRCDLGRDHSGVDQSCIKGIYRSSVTAIQWSMQLDELETMSFGIHRRV